METFSPYANEIQMMGKMSLFAQSVRIYIYFRLEMFNVDTVWLSI